MRGIRSRQRRLFVSEGSGRRGCGILRWSSGALSECAGQGGKSPRSLLPVQILDFLCSCPLKRTDVCRLDCSLTVPGKREGHHVLATYSSLNLVGFSNKSNVLPTCTSMMSSSFERNRPGVRLMSGPGSERWSHTGVSSRSSSHCRTSLSDIGLVIKVTAGGQPVHSVLRQRRLSGDLTYGVTLVSGDDGAHA